MAGPWPPRRPGTGRRRAGRPRPGLRLRVLGASEPEAAACGMLALGLGSLAATQTPTADDQKIVGVIFSEYLPSVAVTFCRARLRVTSPGPRPRARLPGYHDSPGPGVLEKTDNRFTMRVVATRIPHRIAARPPRAPEGVLCSLSLTLSLSLSLSLFSPYSGRRRIFESILPRFTPLALFFIDDHSPRNKSSSTIHASSRRRVAYLRPRFATSCSTLRVTETRTTSSPPHLSAIYSAFK